VPQGTVDVVQQRHMERMKWMRQRRGGCTNITYTVNYMVVLPPLLVFLGEKDSCGA
jgi:hypothetical protein